MKILTGLFLSGAAIFFVSCTSFTPPLISVARFSSPINDSSSIDTNCAVVYGRFATGPDFAFGNELALRLRNESSKRVYLIRCRDKDPVYAIAVEPGRYRVAGFLATYMDHRPVGQRKFAGTNTFDVKSGSATYLGDFTGYARVGVMAQEWGISGMTNNFAASTDEYKVRYSKLSSLPVASAFEEKSN